MGQGQIVWLKLLNDVFLLVKPMKYYSLNEAAVAKGLQDIGIENRRGSKKSYFR